MYFFILLISTDILKMSFIHQTSFRNNLPCLNEKLHYFFLSLLTGKQHYPEWNCDGQPIATAKLFLWGTVQ